MKKYGAEFVGTFALVFCGTGAIVINDVTDGSLGDVGIGLTFGLIVGAMIYVFGSISGAHINPAVTIAFSLTDRFDRKLLLGYLVSQIAGAVAASSIVKLLYSEHKNLGTTFPSGAWSETFVLEAILTYVLMLVILGVSQSKSYARWTALAVGVVVGLEATFAGPFTGASMNPARSIGPAIISGNVAELWMYILAPILGAVLAVLTWKWMKRGD